jgi:hypothetical protein
MQIQRNIIFILWFSVMGMIHFTCTPRSKFAPHFSIAHQDPFGSAISLKYRSSQAKTIMLEGELLAVENDTIYVLTTSHMANIKTKENYLHRVEKINQKSLISYKVRYAKVQTSNAFVLSSILTIFHGYFAFISFPINMVFLAALDDAENNLYTLQIKKLKFTELYKYARFPQGLPNDINFEMLYPRDFDAELKKFGY